MGAIAYLTEQLARMQISGGRLRGFAGSDLMRGDNRVDAAVASLTAWMDDSDGKMLSAVVKVQVLLLVVNN
jgi:hypothetical protein